MSFQITPGIAESELKNWLTTAAAEHGTFSDGRVDYTNAKEAPVVMCAITYGNEILLTKRGHGLADADGYWSVVMGFIDEDLPVAQIARKELSEEIQLDFPANKIKVGTSYHLNNTKEKREYTVFPCLIKLAHKPTIVLDEEHTEYKWITRDELESYDILEDLVHGIDTALDL